MSFEKEYFCSKSIYRKYLDFQTGCSCTERWYSGCFNYIEKKFQVLNGAQRIALDLGFGYGGVRTLLRKRGFRVLSFDVSEYTTQAAKKWGGENWEVVQADAEAIPLRGSIDLVVSLEVLEHLRKPEIAIGEVFRTLKPGGTFWASSPNPDCSIPLYRHPEQKDPTHISIKSPDEWGKLFVAVGFELVTVETLLFVPYIWRKPLNLSLVISSGLWGPDTLLLGRKPYNSES